MAFYLFHKCDKAFHLTGLQRNAAYYQGIWHALRTICRDEGVFGLYKGLGATLLVSAIDQSLSSSEKEKVFYDAN